MTEVDFPRGTRWALAKGVERLGRDYAPGKKGRES